MSLGLIGIESYEFVVANIERSRKFYVDRMDFREVAQSNRDLAQQTGEESSVFKAGKIQVQVTSPLNQRSRAAKYLAWHPDGIPVVSFRVKDLKQTWSFLEGNHATFLGDPEEHRQGNATYRSFSIATALGDVAFRFVERQDFAGYAPGFEDLTPADEGNQFRMLAVDHITVNLLSLAPWVNWCSSTPRTFGRARAVPA
jgi:4-hydroxyphenylpyruvate dioxygenase